ncbi:MAG: hypothetical protein DHS20C11_37280 [Lysobacteraceae bacterium]|nr:MAG: hypothetical protein DHS20C11_37280 [Xanthomonadaceae bacterium]
MKGLNTQQGLTLIELLISLTLLSVVLIGGIPAFSDFTANNRMITEKNRLVGEVNLARSEAILRSQRVVLCPSTDGMQCLADPHWHAGRLIFIDSNANRERDPNELILRATEATDASLSVLTPRSRRRVIFYPIGFAPGSNATFTFCDGRGADHAQAVILSNTGRPRTSSRGPGGRELRC